MVANPALGNHKLQALITALLQVELRSEHRHLAERCADREAATGLPRDPAQASNLQREDAGPAFLQALKEQLGLTLKPTTTVAAILVVDHIEQPSPN